MSVFDSPRPLVFAHRGGCALGPENTLAAFDVGMAAGADGLELDVHLSADGVVMVHHDATLDRTTDASGPIAARSADELGRVNASCRFPDAVASAAGTAVAGARTWPAELTGVPTLEAVLRRYGPVPMIVEMKVDSPAMGQALAREIGRFDAADCICAAGFGWRSLRTIRAAMPGVTTSASRPETRVALYRSRLGWPVRRVPYGGYQVPEVAGTLRVVSPRFIRHAHAAGLKVHVWTVDEPDDMRRLLEWGVDGLITNRPDLAVQVRDAFVDRRRA